MNWWTNLFSSDNSKTDFKAVMSAVVLFVAVGMYLAYGIKGLFMAWDMPASIRDITVTLILGGGTGAAATLLNKKLGVDQPPMKDEKLPTRDSGSD